MCVLQPTRPESLRAKASRPPTASVGSQPAMGDDVLLASKARSASICAPGFSSMEQALLEAQDATDDGATSTPGGRRRRPAARSQSARLTKSVRRRRPEDGTSPLKGGCSEPRLDNVDDVPSPNVRRKGSTRRSVHATTRKSAAFLDVPGGGGGGVDDEESYRLRSFSFSSKGVINRGDSFRRRRSRSSSLVPPAQNAGGLAPPGGAHDGGGPPTASYRVAIVGAPGVGKTALISQFMTSECINAYDRQRDGPTEQSVSIMLNGEESELVFVNVSNTKEIDVRDPPDAYLVAYSVVDKASLARAEDELARLQDWDLLRSRPAILVGNKVDLARSRLVSSQDGKCLACTYRAKFIEVSVGISHNIDELLVGTLTQIRLKLEHADEEDADHHWYKSRGVVRASMKARQMLTWVFGKEDSKFRNCENFNVL